MGQSDDDRTSATGTSHRGFASMDEAKQRAIASKGGQSVPPEKRSFSQNPDLAAQAGRKGGENVPSHERSFSRNRALAAEAGRKGGQSSRSGVARERASDNGVSGHIPDTGKGIPGEIPRREH